jgi:hypothetical protein
MIPSVIALCGIASIKEGKDAIVPKGHAMKTYRIAKKRLHAFLTSTVDGGDWLGSGSNGFKNNFRCPLNRDWIDNRNSLVALVKKKSLLPRI